MQIIDKIDKKILATLERDGRALLSTVAKEAGLSKPGAAKRIARLEKEGIIDGYLTHVSFRALELFNFRLYLKFEGAPAGFEESVAAWLKKQGCVRWFAFCQGEYDLIVRTMVKDLYEFREFEQAMQSEFGRHIGRRVFAAIINDAYHNCTHITGNEGNSSVPGKEYAGTAVKMAEADLKVLYHLFENCRQSAREIAKKAGMKPDAVLYHIRKLEREGVITRYSVKIGREKLGYSTVKAIFWLRKATLDDIGKLKKYLEMHPRVSFYGEIVGPWDIEADFDVSGNAEAHRFIGEIRARFAGIIHDFTVLGLIKEHEANFLAGRLEEAVG
ncbi:MAG: Lrp/AsnC family transcriptional regulator [Candidatus Micrarchaeota archaeon]|nr:Lrp/AsnC family transcriptional regulator [Candidatus Micrarchaeota archaeon]